MERKTLLEVAIAAAREAGELLRAEFHRPGGPRGHDGHAPVDEEAEHAIRKRLVTALPEAGWLGEETGSAGPAGARLRWVVDPNDGTSSFLKGFRGSAVSIALLEDDVPVLGVVFAPVAPDDAGDLIAWCEGGPITRNGRVVERAPLPVALDPEVVLLVSQDADRASAANARLCAPARFRAVPSIAYRLALAAVGEGDAAVSLNGPVSWDYAAGHALLRGAGGELVQAGGRPVRYNSGATDGGVFGGSASVAAELSRRSWHLVLAEKARPAVGLVRLERGGAIGAPELLARAQGALLGQLAGDALGSMVEFEGARKIARNHPGRLTRIGPSPVFNTIAGQPTDDSEMALALARTLVANGPDLPAILSAYRRWLASGPFDSGTTTRAGLAGRPSLSSQANGGLMRVSPLGVFGHAMRPEALADFVRDECGLTHPHRVCRDASAAYAVAVAHAVRTGAPAAEVHETALGWARGHASPAVVASLEAAAERPPEDFESQQGWVLIALQNAFFRLLHAATLEDGIVDTAMCGGDTDTNAAIAGALLGAVHGRDAIPLQWRRSVLSCRPLPGTGQPRPPEYWPVDALELAERLLVAGQGMAEKPGAMVG